MGSVDIMYIIVCMFSRTVAGGGKGTEYIFTYLFVSCRRH